MRNPADQVQVSLNDDKIKIQPVLFSGEIHRVVATRTTILAFQGLETEKRRRQVFFVFEFGFLPTAASHIVCQSEYTSGHF